MGAPVGEGVEGGRGGELVNVFPATFHVISWKIDFLLGQYGFRGNPLVDAFRCRVTKQNNKAAAVVGVHSYLHKIPKLMRNL